MMPTPQPVYFIDFEASGIHPESYPIAVAICDCTWHFTALIQPMPYWTYWSYDAQDMHGITREQLIAEGTAPHELAIRLNQRYHGKALCSSNPVDAFWLDMLFEAAGVEAQLDLKPLEAWIGPNAAAEVLRLMPSHSAHNALSDAQALERAYATWRIANASNTGNGGA
ncbi:hypothetical protein [Pseudomonas sp. S1(2024)]|uniref:hypothetical protein n=1 Tax=Pseudomonas sp. S1(2024) TaxID=3390191 RepID=UPI00397D8FB5